MTKNAVTEWKNWRDVFARETIVELGGKYKSTTLHTWTRPRYAAHDVPGPMNLSSYASVKLKSGRRVNLDVVLTPQAIDAIRSNAIHIDRDTMNAEVIEWQDGRALVVIQRSQIIGSVWLAFVDASTIPAFPPDPDDTED